MTLCGESIAGLGRFDEAEPLLREGYERMEEDPKSAHRALRSLICCYKVLGKPDEAARYRKLLDSGSAANK
jgi:hypothetical protein